MKLMLASYFRSSAAYRVRIALALKGIDYDVLPIHLLKNGGEQFSASYLKLNPEARVPALLIGEEDHQEVLTQSLAMIEYLDEVFPQFLLLPGDAMQRAKIRSFSQLIASDIHPLNNLSVLQYLTQYHQFDEAAKQRWIQHWIGRGFQVLEDKLNDAKDTLFCFGDRATLADCCLIPQVFNAIRFQVDMLAYPKIMRIYEYACTLPVFMQAAPAQQPDAI